MFLNIKEKIQENILNTLYNSFSLGSLKEDNLLLCQVIDSIGISLRSKTIEWVCDQYLIVYDKSMENTSLNDMKNRFTWFKQRMDLFTKNLLIGFPKEWRVPYYLTLTFCGKTFNHIEKLFNKQEPNVKDYLSAFEVSIKFEEKMAQLFSTTEDIESENKKFDNDYESLKQKYSSNTKEKRIVLANEFYGRIASAFVKYINLYLNFEEENFSTIIKKAQTSGENDIDNEEHILQSSTALILSIRKSIDKCSLFRDDQSLFNFFKVIVNSIIKYIKKLTSILPKKAIKDWEFQYICCITNSTNFILTIIDSLAQKIISLLKSESIKNNVGVEENKEIIGIELKNQLVHLSNLIIKENESLLIQIGNGSWEPENSHEKIPQKLKSNFENRFNILISFLSNENLNRIRSNFIQSVIQVIRDSFFKLKIVHFDVGTNLASILKELKDFLKYLTKADSKITQKRIEIEFSHFEGEITVILSPELAMVDIYMAKIKNKNKEHFQSLLKLKGLKGQDEQLVLDQFNLN